MKEVQEKLFDDLVHHKTGEKAEADVTVSFSFDGADLEIDLTEQNAALFAEVVKDFVDAARPAARKSGTKKKSAAATSTSASNSAPKKASSSKEQEEENRRIREWANGPGGFDLSSRGRLPQEVRDAYFAAVHGTPAGEVTADSLTDQVPTDSNFTPVAEPAENGASVEEANSGDDSTSSESGEQPADEPTRV